MKIGIMTLWDTQENYGAVLQCYALQEYLRHYGHEPFLIRYKRKRSGINLRGISLKKIIRQVERIFSQHSSGIQRHFDDFFFRYITQTDRDYIGYEELKKEPPEADVYLVGSDQVWNFYNVPINLCRGDIHAFFLDFGKPETKKVSYAASWNGKYVKDEHMNEIIPLIRNFSYVSVREESGLRLCHICGIDDAEKVFDPTLLLSADEYRKIYREAAADAGKKEKAYLLIYFVLSQKYSQEDVSYIYQFAADNQLEVVCISDGSKDIGPKRCYPTIPEWLYLMDNAEYIVTNSFHGTAFSLLFHKKFATIPLMGYAGATNERMDSLWDIFGTEARYAQNKDLSVLHKPYSTNFKIVRNRFTEMVENRGGYRCVLIKSCTNGNLGDDLFVHIILRRYRSARICFYLLVYDIGKYAYMLDEYPNLVLVEYPVPRFAPRIIAKAEEIVLGIHGLKELAWTKAYRHLGEITFDAFVNVGGSMLAEYPGEKYVFSLSFESIILNCINAKHKCLININVGPYVTESFKDQCGKLFNRYDFVTFRDKKSFRLFGNKQNIMFFRDIALSEDYEGWTGRIAEQKNGLMLVNVIDLSKNKRILQKTKPYIEKYTKTVLEVVEMGLNSQKDVCLLAFSRDSQEEQYIDGLIHFFKSSPNGVRLKKLVYNGRNLKEIIYTLSAADSLFSTRFHAMILGFALGIRQYPICYDQKLTNFLLDSNYEGPFSDLQSMEDSRKIFEYLEGGSTYYVDIDILKSSKGHLTVLDAMIKGE